MMLTKVEFLAQALLAVPRPGRWPHCGSGTTRRIARKYAIAKVLQCDSCHLHFTHPIYRTRFASEFYDRLYAAEGLTTRLPAMDELLGLKLSQFRGTDKDAHDRLGRMRDLFDSSRPTLLEFGSSWGYFVYQAASADFDATGVEIGDRRREFGRSGLGVTLVRDLASLPLGRTFDCVYTAHVIEHIPDLADVLAGLTSRVAAGGSLFIEVPNLKPAGRPYALNLIGAVHPLGFDSRFFQENLPRYGLDDVQIFSGWESFPGDPANDSSGDAIVVWARRSGTTAAAMQS